MARLQIAGSGGESINYLRDVYHLTAASLSRGRRMFRSLTIWLSDPLVTRKEEARNIKWRVASGYKNGSMYQVLKILLLPQEPNFYEFII